MGDQHQVSLLFALARERLQPCGDPNREAGSRWRVGVVPDHSRLRDHRLRDGLHGCIAHDRRGLIDSNHLYVLYLDSRRRRRLLQRDPDAFRIGWRPLHSRRGNHGLRQKSKSAVHDCTEADFRGRVSDIGPRNDLHRILHSAAQSPPYGCHTLIPVRHPSSKACDCRSSASRVSQHTAPLIHRRRLPDKLGALHGLILIFQSRCILQ